MAESPMPSSFAERYDCVIAGGGPAGAVLGLLLARAGLNILLLEKHGDFLRDFRGDTIHPATLELLDQLGLADRFLQLPHSEVHQVMMPGRSGLVGFSFRNLPSKYRFVAFVPQWDFLNFITDEAKRYPGFHLLMNAEVTDLVVEDGVVRGVHYRTADGEHTALAQLTVGADGRTAITRTVAGLRPIENGVPMDVLWFRISRRPDEPASLVGRTAPGRFGVQINRGDYWQVAYIIPKGGIDAVHAAGLPAFRQDVAALMPELADRVDELQDWDQVKLLTVQSNRLPVWWVPGYLAIGDAAHAMSPVGGVGINLAIQDAVEAANVLWRPLREGRVTTADLAAVQRKRDVPTRIIQELQNLMQRQVIAPTLAGASAFGDGDALLALSHLPLLRDLPPRLIGLGVGRPRVSSPEVGDGEVIPLTSASAPSSLPEQQLASALLGTAFAGAGVVRMARSRAQEATPEAGGRERIPGVDALGLLLLGAGVSLLAPLVRSWREGRRAAST